VEFDVSANVGKLRAARSGGGRYAPCIWLNIVHRQASFPAPILNTERIRDDGAYLMMNRFEAIRPYTSPADVYDIVRREFNAAYTEGGIFQLTMHPHVTGYRSRIWTLGGRTWVPLVRVLHEWAELRHAQGYPFRLSNSYHPRA
jgi:hypothetical protein